MVPESEVDLIRAPFFSGYDTRVTAAQFFFLLGRQLSSAVMAGFTGGAMAATF
jgi:hypothetical protein